MKAMTDNIEQIDDFYKNLLKDSTVEPDASVWINIESGLDLLVDSSVLQSSSQISSLASSNGNTSAIAVSIANTVTTKSIITTFGIAKFIGGFALVSTLAIVSIYLANKNSDSSKITTLTTTDSTYKNNNLPVAYADAVKIQSNENEQVKLVKEKNNLSMSEKHFLKSDPEQIDNNQSGLIQNAPPVNSSASEKELPNADKLETKTDILSVSKTKEEPLKTEEIIEREAELPAFKKPKNFYEKYAEKLKDSTREIFIPKNSKK